ncbi:MAG: hypothetical protein HOY78_36830, partial [Saccharothrix sp.]|nr:hypothetical protein [Saccharothrix sp.]
MSVRRGMLRAVAVGVVALVAVGCSASGATESGSGTSAGTTTSTTPPAKPVSLSTGPVDQAVDVAPGLPVVATATDGKLTQVALTNPEGKPVAGQLSPDGLQWTNTEPLGYGKSYTLAVTGQGVDGKTATKTSTFTTVQPRTLSFLSI